MRSDLPSGTVTFLFTDVEGSTKLLDELGAEGYANALAEHRNVLREAFRAQDGVEVDTQGDAIFVAFPTGPGALRAAAEAIDGLASGRMRVRMGIHTGTPYVGEEGYVGVDVHRAARIAACGHGGQVLVSASTAALVGTEALRDLGEHRLKDLSAPERIYQLGHGDFPPLMSLHQTNLPIPATPFLGREQELEQVLGLLSTDEIRLLTLTGAGGAGKTRLALQAAGGLADRYPHGVWWVPLAPLRDPQLVLPTAAAALGATDDLAEHVAGKSLLLLLDNFEHVVDAAAELAALLASSPGLDLLVTSREPLHVTGEQEYSVPPLVHDEGVDFFLARARAVEPDFQAEEAVPEICRRLDDLPLALELAAARVKALSAKQILERLEQRLPLLTGAARDVPERQRTLRATIEWSYDLLDQEEQRLFARLAVFRGGCTLDAAERVVGADLDTLQALVDKSLLRHADERFWMLETIREFAGERLEDGGEGDELRRRHAQYFLAIAEEVEPSLRAEASFGEAAPSLDRLDPEHDNVRAALDRLEAAGESELVLRLASAMRWYWDGRLHLTEGRQRLERALKDDTRPSPARAKALVGAADFAIGDGDAELGRLRAEEALELYRTLGVEGGAAEATLMLGIAAGDGGDFLRARECFEESGRAFHEVGDEFGAFASNYQLAFAFKELGDRERAHALLDQCLREAQVLRKDAMVAATLQALAKLALGEERLEDAVSLAKRSLRIRHQAGTRLGVADGLSRCANALALEGHVKTATRLFACSLAVREELGAGLRPGFAAELEQGRTAIRKQLDAAAFDEAWEQGRSLTVDEAVALALDPTD